MKIPGKTLLIRVEVIAKLRSLANILVSFANADGGTVALGIKNKQFEGIDHLDTHKINDFKQVGYDLIHPALKVKTEFQKVTVNGKDNRIMLLTVESSDKYVFSNSKDDVYLRIGDESKKLTYKQIESLNYSKDIRSYEQGTVETALLADLDQDLLEQYKKLNHFNGDDVWKLLFSKGFANRKMTSDDSYVYKLNVAGVLMFAEIPDAFIPGARVRLI
ncbi:AlbA family DNA-binding domain-containing protein [Limosilactobacillus vaginalis]|uniref:AlbA family DNA-binding domain-containing protein n=1 Tax=Limosilactobacillus vaginalis TaxID=1633 RepID=UPI001F088FD1|nr:ATP-binding protein [Limosilactobacillus vaginalis]